MYFPPFIRLPFASVVVFLQIQRHFAAPKPPLAAPWASHVEWRWKVLSTGTPEKKKNMLNRNLQGSRGGDSPIFFPKVNPNLPKQNPENFLGTPPPLGQKVGSSANCKGNCSLI